MDGDRVSLVTLTRGLDKEPPWESDGWTDGLIDGWIDG